MRFLLALFTVLLVAAGTLSAAASASDDDAIRQLIKQYVDVRNHMDEKVLRDLFTPDADQLVSTGTWRRGRAELLKGAIASSKKENGQSSVTVESVRILGHDTAIADGRYETAATGASASRRMWSTFVLQRTSSGWRIAAIRNMLPAR
jgi:uncharacterized protein (TIGR02246 family)